MAKTRAQGRALTRTLLATASTDTGTWADAELDLYLDDGQREVAATIPVSMLDANLATNYAATVTASASNPTFSLPVGTTAVMRLLGVFRSSTSAPTYSHVERVDDITELYRKRGRSTWASASEQTDYYAQMGRTLHLAPAYDSAQIYTAFYVKVPPALSATQNFTVPDHLFELVCYRAAVTALQKAGDFTTAASFLETYDRKRGELIGAWDNKPPVAFTNVTKQG